MRSWPPPASVGPGITISAHVLGDAFFVAGLTEFTGVAELGLVAGGGDRVLLVGGDDRLAGGGPTSDAPHPDRELPTPLDFHLWIKPFFDTPADPRRRAGGHGGGGLRNHAVANEYNLLHLQPTGLESVDLEQKVLSRARKASTSPCRWPRPRRGGCPQGPIPATADRRAGGRDRLAVSVGAWGEKRPYIERIRQRLAGLPEQPANSHGLADQLGQCSPQPSR